MGGHM